MQLPEQHKIKCPLCQSTQYRVLGTHSQMLRLPNPFRIVKCSGCDLIALAPQPTKEEYEKHYASADYYSPADYESRAKLKEHLFYSRLMFIDTFINPNQRNKILDVGCAGGNFLSIAQQEMDWTPVGVEFTEKLAQQAEKLLGCHIYRNLSELVAAKETVDVVHLNHVYEHLPDPLVAAQEIIKVLNPGGFLFIEVPHQFSSFKDLIKILAIDILGEKIALKMLKPGVDELHHTFFYTPKTLENLLRKAGFDIQYKSTINRAYYTPESFLGIKRFIYRFIDEITNVFSLGPIIIVVAQKPNE